MAPHKTTHKAATLDKTIPRSKPIPRPMGRLNGADGDAHHGRMLPTSDDHESARRLKILEDIMEKDKGILAALAKL